MSCDASCCAWVRLASMSCDALRSRRSTCDRLPVAASRSSLAMRSLTATSAAAGVLTA